MATLEDLEARVAVLAAVSALGADQRELADGQRQLKSDVAEVKAVAAGCDGIGFKHLAGGVPTPCG